MRLIKHKLAAATAVAAAFSLVATPAAAIELPRPADAPQVRDAGALDVENRRHRGRGHRDWDEDDIDGDDILAGVLILGGIAAIAGIANSGRNRQERYPEPEPFPDDAQYRPSVRDSGYRSGAMTDAVEACVAEAEAGHGPVGSVDRASRSGEGWYVAGELDSGTAFACWVDGSGRVTDLEAGGYSARYETPEPDEAEISAVQKQAIEGDPDDARYALAEVAE